MRAVEQAPRNKKQKERRAKPARRSFAFHSPRPQLLKGPTKESMSSKPKPSDGDFVAAIRGSVADAFFGASPVVASALGIRSGATPRGRIHSKPHPSALPRKEDISTLLGIGHFYFALTVRSGMATHPIAEDDLGLYAPERVAEESRRPETRSSVVVLTQGGANSWGSPDCSKTKLADAGARMNTVVPVVCRPDGD